MSSHLLIAASTAAPLWAAVVAAAAGVFNFAMTRQKEARVRQRETYAQAWKTALAWREMVYRVRRRDADGGDDQDLVRRFHDLQEDLDYYEGVLLMERAVLGETYRELVDTYKAVCLPMLRDAWAREGRPPTKGILDDDKHPDQDPRLKQARAKFVREARDQLSGASDHS